MRPPAHPLHEFVHGWFVQRSRSSVDRAVQCLREQGVPDEAVSAALRVVDEVLRQSGKDRLVIGPPHISVCTEDSPYVRVRFALDISATEVAELGWKLTERIVERRLDYPALVVGFTTASQASAREAA